MTSLNVVNLVGRVGGEPEVRYFESGKVKATFTLAVDRGKGKDPDWFNVETWGTTAEIVAKFVEKGKQVAVQGSLKLDFWKDKKSGEDRSKPLVNCNRLTLLGSKSDAGESRQVSQPASEALPWDDEYSDDDIPM